MRIWLVLLIAFSGVQMTASRQTPSAHWVQAYHGQWFVPPSESQYFTFGFSESFADSLWLRLIQNIDFCERRDVQEGQVKMFYHQTDQNRSVEVDANGKSAAQNQLTDPLDENIDLYKRVPACEKGWVYHMLDRITDFSPRFRLAYAVGAVGLSVLVDDREGARLLFDKAIVAFPNDWPILYRAAYHYLFEYNDQKTAADLLVRASRAGAPYWTAALAGQLYSKSGRAALGKQVIESMLERYPEGPQAEHLRKRLRDIEAGR